jgi:starch phosphorylase
MFKKIIDGLAAPASLLSQDPVIQGINYELQNSLDGGLSRVTIETATKKQIYKALSRFIMREIRPVWVNTREKIQQKDLKQTYYFSMEFLIGRALGNNLINLGMYAKVQEALSAYEIDINEVEAQEDEAGLGNGGLGRLAACYLDSAATLGLPVQGMGLWYENGIFAQEILNGVQVEKPDLWLKKGYCWHITEEDAAVKVRYGGRVEHANGRPLLVGYEEVTVVPRLLPIVGYSSSGQPTINTLTLWRVKANAETFDMHTFNSGEHDHAILELTKHQKLTSVLYPNENTAEGKKLRLRQEFLMVSAGLQMICRNYERRYGDNYDWFADKIALQINDTHPALLGPELLRIIVDEKKVSLPENEIEKIFAGLTAPAADPAKYFDKTDKGYQEKDNIFARLIQDLPEHTAQEIYRQVRVLKLAAALKIIGQALAYTNHTIMGEALEKWDVSVLKELLPRQYEIICEINQIFCDKIRKRYPGDEERVRRMSVIEAGQVRMANLAFILSHSVNGVAALHTEILKNTVLKDFHEYFPERLNNKTNGITPRRWLLQANPRLAGLLNRRLGAGWITDLSQLKQLERFADDEAFLKELLEIKRSNKQKLADYIYADNPVKNSLGQIIDRLEIDPRALFVAQSKRLHEYKRQQLTALYIHSLYNHLLDNPLEIGARQPLVFLFGAKAAPGYHDAKDIIRYINILARQINNDSILQGKLKIVFVENYNVSKAQLLIPAADISLQISTAGMEASGTGNMKYALNGAVTVGTLDGANVEMLEQVGADNMLIFGRRAEEIAALQTNGRYSPRAHYENNPALRRCLDEMLSADALALSGAQEHEALQRIANKLLSSDPYFTLEDFDSFVVVMQQAQDWYQDRRYWARKILSNIANMGNFSSDRSVSEYARDIWGLEQIE